MSDRGPQRGNLPTPAGRVPGHSVNLAKLWRKADLISASVAASWMKAVDWAHGVSAHSAAREERRKPPGQEPVRTFTDFRSP